MGLKNRTDTINNERLNASAKERAAQVKAGKAANPKNQQGETADGRPTGIKRRNK